MFEYLKFVVTFMIYPWLGVQGFENSLKYSRFQKASTDQIYGNLTERTGVKTLIGCIVHCRTDPGCKGAVLTPDGEGTAKCKMVKSGTDFIKMTDYEYYSIKRCADPDLSNYDFLLDVGLPCPRLYFPLDEDTGTRLGSSPGNIQFVSGGKVGQAFLNPVTNSVRSYYNLGYYQESGYCFLLVETCPLGITVAFWLKILDGLEGRNGIFTTRQGVCSFDLISNNTTENL